MVRFAHELLSARDRWTRHVWARDSSGQEVDASSAEAVCWCVGGAVLAANFELYGGAVRIPVDRRTNNATMIRQPKRAAAAAEAIGIAFRRTSPQQIRLSSAPGMDKPERDEGSYGNQHPTLLATDINDLSLIEHPHVALALAWALAALNDEVARRARSRGISRVPGAAAT